MIYEGSLMSYNPDPNKTDLENETAWIESLQGATGAQGEQGFKVYRVSKVSKV